MMMQEKSPRSLNYTKIDRCQNNLSIDSDEFYRQIFYLNDRLNNSQEKKFEICFLNRYQVILFCFLILISQANTSPIYQSSQSKI